MKNTLVLIFVLFLLGCSGGEDLGGLGFSDEDAAKVAFEDSTVKCENEDDCPNFSGALFSFHRTYETDYWGETQESYFIGFCSQQLIAPNKILTNRHCLPSIISYKGASCSGIIQLKFPKTSQYEATSVDCSRVIDLTSNEYYTNEHSVHMDWAILELKKNVDRPPAELNKNGVPFNSSVKAYPTYFQHSYSYRSGDSFSIGHGIIKKNECTTNTSIFFGMYYHEQGPMFMVNRCDLDVVGGNSGSGLLNSSNELIGVISIGIDPSNRDFEYSENKNSVLINQKISGGTNLHCIKPLNPSPGPMCSFQIENIESFSNMGMIANNLELLRENFVERKARIYEEMDSSQYVQYSQDIPYLLIDLFLGNNNELYSGVPENILSEVLSPRLNSLFAGFPVCVLRDSPDNFETRLGYLDLFEEDTMSVNSNGEVYIEDVDLRTNYLQLKYQRELDSYSVSLSRATSQEIEIYEKLAKDVQDLDKKCKSNSGNLYYCSQLKRKKEDFKSWKNKSSIEPAIWNNEKLLQRGLNVFELTLPICP